MQGGGGFRWLPQQTWCGVTDREGMGRFGYSIVDLVGKAVENLAFDNIPRDEKSQDQKQGQFEKVYILLMTFCRL